MPKNKFIPYSLKLKDHAREMRKNPTAAEKNFWHSVLRNKEFDGLLFLRQKPLLNYIVDFYCSELLLAIELDGDSHIGNEEYDRLRTEDLDKYGVKVVRYENCEAIQGLDGISENLKAVIEERKRELKINQIPPTPPSAKLRTCFIKEE